LREFLLEVDAVEQMLVFRTSGGGAGPIAEVLDDTAWPEIAGTIAGENTVFALCRSAEAARTIRQRIEELAGTR
jgi:transcriptional regulator of arginine metabolism